MITSEYLLFKDITPPDRKTTILEVISRSSNIKLGTIKWYGAWRQYVFYPEYNTLWNRDCLTVINIVITDLMNIRKHRALP